MITGMEKIRGLMKKALKFKTFYKIQLKEHVTINHF